MLLLPHLPNINTDILHVSESIQEGVFLVLRVGDLGMHPFTLVVGVVNLFRLPLTLSRWTSRAPSSQHYNATDRASSMSSLHLVLRVGDHGWLPLAISVIVPVFWLVRIGVRDVLGLVPVLVTAVCDSVGGLRTGPVHRIQLLRTLLPYINTHRKYQTNASTV